MSFEKNIFINCPFDKEFTPLLKVLLFTCFKLGFNPRIALERSDSAEVRFEKIKELIEESTFSIHDLSKTKSFSVGEYYRLNMPFELGLDLGCRYYHSDLKYRNKKMLILEKERYSTQKVLSDLSFADCKCHEGDEENVVYIVREWFVENGFKIKESAISIWEQYNFFITNVFEQKKREGFRDKDIQRITIAEFMSFIRLHLTISN